MNADARLFIKRNGINVEKINKQMDSHIYSGGEINKIVAEYGIYLPEKTTVVSVADIMGYDTDWRGVPKNIFKSIDSFFDSYGDGYHSRSVGMLAYSADDIMQKLSPSFKSEPIVLSETGENSYTVSTNGLHRYTVLRALYLSECEKANGNQEQLKEIRKKYEISAQVREVDEVKTYSNYILTEYANDIRRVESQYDSNWRKTDNVEVTTKQGEKTVLTDAELIALTKEKSKDIKSPIDLMFLERAYSRYNGFKQFVDKYLGKELPFGNERQQKGGIEL